MGKRISRRQIDMVHGPLARDLLLFSVPLMLSNLLQLLFNAADVVVVGRFAGKAALASVGSTSSLVSLLIVFFIGISTGSNVVVAQDLGSGQDEAAVSRDVHTAITLALIGGTALMVLGTAMSRQLLEWTSTPEDIIDLAALYLRIYFLGMPAHILYNFGAAMLRAQGDTQRPLYFLLISGVLNVAFNLYFVIVWHLGVAGVALATIISQYLSAAMVLVCLMRDPAPLRLDLRKLGLDWRTVKRIARVGLPAGLQSIVFAISNVIIQSAINSFGSTVVAGSSASANIESFVNAPMNAFYHACLTFSSQNYGAGETRRVDRIMVLCQIYVAAAGLALGSLAVLFGHPLAAIYAPGDEEVIAQAMLRLSYACGPYFLCGMMDIFGGTLRGIGYSVMPTVVSMVGACGLRIVWIATIFRAVHTPAMLYLSYPVSWIVTAAVHLLFFLSVRKSAYAKAACPSGEGGARGPGGGNPPADKPAGKPGHPGVRTARQR